MHEEVGEGHRLHRHQDHPFLRDQDHQVDHRLHDPGIVTQLTRPPAPAPVAQSVVLQVER